MYKRLTVLLMLTLLSIPWAASEAQDDGIGCPDLVVRALEIVSDSCAGLDRNQACYGHDTVMATLSPDAAEVNFSAPSDRVDVTYIRDMTTSPMNLDTGEWGVAVMKVQADIPDTIPGQAVTFILYGDVHIQNAGGDSPMQAFYFTTGLGEPICHEAPPSSLVIQSPEGRTVTLNINGAEVTLSSSVALTAAPSGQMTIFTMHGMARVTVGDARTIAPPGFKVELPLTGPEGMDAAPPELPPLPEDLSRWEALEMTPADILEAPIEVPEGIDPALLETFGHICGDGICHISEFGFCDADCGGLPEPDHHANICGDGVCGYDEFGLCEEDCGPLPECGDGTCEPEEVFFCPADCEAEMQELEDLWQWYGVPTLPEHCYEEWTAECDAWLEETAPESLPESCYEEWTDECYTWIEEVTTPMGEPGIEEDEGEMPPEGEMESTPEYDGEEPTPEDDGWESTPEDDGWESTPEGNGRESTPEGNDWEPTPEDDEDNWSPTPE